MKRWPILSVFSLLACSAIAQTRPQANVPNTDTDPNPGITYARVLGPPVTQVQRLLTPLAMAMPDEKYGFAPTNGEFKGVRTFAEQLKHVAASNYSSASIILGEKPPADIGEDENGPASLKTKAEVLKYLQESFSYVQKAVASIDAKNAIQPIKSPFGQGSTTRVAMVTLIVGHCYDHYGQLVEYVRMSGIVPPASQR